MINPYWILNRLLHTRGGGFCWPSVKVPWIYSILAVNLFYLGYALLFRLELRAMHIILLLLALGHLPVTILAEPMRADRMNI